MTTPAIVVRAFAEPSERGRVALVAVVVALLAVTALGWAMAIVTQPEWFARSFAVDFQICMDALARWWTTGEWYRARQLHGPYPIELGDVLYPPVLIYLLVPFRLLGPALWSLIPLVVIASSVVRCRPTPRAWLLIALCVAWPVTPAKFLFGNPVIWLTAAMALGMRYHWPAALVVIKPTVIPFALVGARHRSWWLMLVALALLSLPFLQDTLRYIPVLLDAMPNPVDGRGGPLYSLQEFPLLLIPVIAWLGRTRLGDPSRDQDGAALVSVVTSPSPIEDAHAS